MTYINPAIVWLLLVIVLLGIELATMGLTTIWFAGGALAAFVSTFFGASPAVQRTIFILLSLVLLIVTRPLAKRFMEKDHVKTNVESMIGKVAIISVEVNNLAGTGEAMIGDISWMTRSRSDSQIIPAGSKVRICEIEGVKLIVEEIKEEV